MDTLSTTTLTYDSNRLPLLEVIGDPVHGTDGAIVGVKMGGQVIDSKKGFRQVIYSLDGMHKTTRGGFLARNSLN